MIFRAPRTPRHLIRSTVVLAIAAGVMGHVEAATLCDQEIGDATVSVFVSAAQDADQVVPSVRRQVESALQAVGVHLLDTEAVRELQTDEVLMAKLANQGISALMEIKEKFRTDFALVANVEFEVVPALGNWWSGIADVTASAYRTEDGKQICAEVATPMGTVDSPSVIGEGRLAARQRALRAGVNGVLEKMGLPTEPLSVLGLTVSSRLAWSKELGGKIHAVGLSRAGDRLALLTGSDGLVAFAVEDGAELRRWPVASKKGGAIAYGPDGALAAGTDRGALFVCEADADCRKLGKSGSKTIAAIDFSPDGHRLAAGAVDGAVRVWDLADPAEPASEWKVGGKLVALDYTASGREIVTATVQGRIGFWDPERQGENVKTFDLEIDSGKLIAAAVSRAGDAIALSIKQILMRHDTRDFNMREDTEIIRLISAATGREYQSFESHDDTATGLVFGRGGRFLASAGLDDKVKLWDTAHARELSTIRIEPRDIGDRVFLDLSADAAHLAAATRSGDLKVWSLE